MSTYLNSGANPLSKINKNNLPLAFYFIVFVVYEIVGYINSFLFNLKGASKDAVYFHELATEWMLHGVLSFEVNSQFYAQLLGILYRVFGPYEFIAVQLNIIAILGAMYLMNKIMLMFGIKKKYRILFILLVALWPSYIPRAGATMREPLMIFMFIGFIYTYLKMKIKTNIFSWMKLMFFSFFMFSLHKAFAVLIFIGGLVILYESARTINITKINGILKLILLSCVFILGTLLLLYISTLNVAGLRELNSLVNNDQEQINTILEYKAGIEQRASYGTKLDLSSLQNIITTYPIVLFNYLFQPFPNRIANFYDLYAFMEVLWRTYAFYIIWKYRKLISGDLWILIIFYALTSLLWAAGTTNYGTASRHHLTHNWILVIIFCAVRPRYKL